MHCPHVERSGDRLGHRSAEPPDQRSDHLSNDQSKRVSAEHGDDRRRIKSPHDQTFEHETERAHHERGRYHSEPDRQAQAVGEVGDIGTQQNELALREVEDTHHAGDDAEPKDDQNHDRAETQYLETRDDQISHGLPPASYCHSLNPPPFARLRFQSASGPLLRSDAPDRNPFKNRAKTCHKTCQTLRRLPDTRVHGGPGADLLKSSLDDADLRALTPSADHRPHSESY